MFLLLVSKAHADAVAVVVVVVVAVVLVAHHCDNEYEHSNFVSLLKPVKVDHLLSLM